MRITLDLMLTTRIVWSILSRNLSIHYRRAVGPFTGSCGVSTITRNDGELLMVVGRSGRVIRQTPKS